jgi:uncharacterized membrane protein YhaH (DUF805 family)
MELNEILPLLIPIAVIQLVLIIFALRDLAKTERRVKGGSKAMWAVLIIFVNFIGPLAYFFIGREDV